MKPQPNRKMRWLWSGLLAVAVLGGGYYVARHYAWPAIKTWRITRMNQEAQKFLDAGDAANALLVARKSLQASTANPAGWRIASKASAARQRPDAVWYQDSLCREEPTKENYIELIRLALLFDVPDYALTAIKAVEKEAGDDPTFHRLAAQAYQRTTRPLLAEAHLIALTHLQPTDLVAQLDLAELQLATDPGRKNAALRTQVLALANQPELRLRALTLLLRDSIASKSTADIEKIVHQLQLTPGLDVPGRLLVIQGLSVLGQPTAQELLTHLQTEVAARPQDVARVLEFLIRNGRSAEAQPWVATLPDAIRAAPDVQHMVAEALLRLNDATGLEAYLRGGNWPRHEYLRQALLAHAYRSLGRSADFAAAWKLALIDAGSDLRKATALLARADEWRWLNERYEVVWKLFALTPTNSSVQQLLITWERHQGNTANLNRLFTRVVEVQPKDPVAANNLAYTDLLLDANLERSSLMARRLATLAPQNPFFATTFAFALLKEGKPADALARIDALTATQRTDPVRMLIKARCLAALGQGGAAADLMDGVITRGMLPEELRLADETRADIARLDRARGNRSQLLALRHGQEQDSGAAGWLALLPDVRRNASTDMQLADSFYATPDWNALQELLRTTRWKADDYLRSALMAYVLRQNGDLLQSHEQWQQALALADREPARLQNLRTLATKWDWAAERLETQNLVFERNPGDPVLLAELLRNYRDAHRTTDMQRVLGLAVGASTDPTDAAVALAYYSILLDTNLARAHVMAQNAFEIARADPVRRTVYAFSLWKQHRAAEAMRLLSDLPPDAKSELVSIPLVRAVIQAQLGAVDAAAASLAKFKSDSALPEEEALATKISGELAAQRETVKPRQT